MNAGELAVAIIVFGFAVWLGAYLIRRDVQNAALRLAGLGILAYALVWAIDALYEAGNTAPLLARLRWPLSFLPALLWTGALLALLPPDAPPGARVWRVWRVAILPLTLAALLISALMQPSGEARPTGLLAAFVALLVLGPLLGAVLLVARERSAIDPRRGAGLLLVALLFFALSTALVVIAPGWLPRVRLLGLVGVDVLTLGVAIAALDAFNQGETLLPDMLRSFDAACCAALLFGGQAALVMALATGPTPPLVALLFGTVAAAALVPTFADDLGAALDRVALGRLPRVRRARSDLRAAANALPRVNTALDLAALDAADFARLTRRALSDFGDLPRLATSPLTRLRLVDCRLAARRAPDDALERAAELKSVLAESIARLKPRTSCDFGATDEWRHYNALYFPYIAGLKPYSRRAAQNGRDDPAARAALAWFRESVPERTLYNWQTIAARLVADDLRGREGNEDEARQKRGVTEKRP